MTKRAWIQVALICVALLALALAISVAGRVGVFQRGDSTEGVAGLDGGAAAPDAGQLVRSSQIEPSRPSMAVSGRAALRLSDFRLDDHQGRPVLALKELHGELDLTALQEGRYRIYDLTATGVDVKLMRASSGRLSITDALSPPKDHAHEQTQSGGATPPPEKWTIEIGPVQVKQAKLELLFTAKKVEFEVDSATVMVRQTRRDPGPVIHISDVIGRMTKPDPLGLPIHIAYAEGVVRLRTKPLVDLRALTCIRRSEIRAHVLVPAHGSPTQLTADSEGFFGALGRMGLKIASRRDKGKLSYHHGAVELDTEARCHARVKATSD